MSKYRRHARISESKGCLSVDGCRRIYCIFRGLRTSGEPPHMGIGVLFNCDACRHAEGYDQRGSGFAHVHSGGPAVSSLDCGGKTWLGKTDLGSRRQESRTGSGRAHFRGRGWRSASNLDAGERNPSACSRSAGQSRGRAGPKTNPTNCEAIVPWRAEIASRSRRAMSTPPSPNAVPSGNLN